MSLKSEAKERLWRDYSRAIQKLEVEKKELMKTLKNCNMEELQNIKKGIKVIEEIKGYDYLSDNQKFAIGYVFSREEQEREVKK